MDSRDFAHLGLGNYIKSVDIARMMATIEVDEVTGELPLKYEVCSTCGGTGRHVDPNIDRHGLSREDFYEDPDFEEEYFAGHYDVDCYGCGGRNVEPAINEGLLSPEQTKLLALVNQNLEDDWDFAQLCEMERRMGA